MKLLVTAQRWWSHLTSHRRTVRIDACYHYRGFRYGGFGHNPYEDYIVDLSRGTSGRRERFVRAIADHRPRTMGEILGLPLLTQAAWDFPWNSAHSAVPKIEDPLQNPDIVCHDCPQGLLVSHFNREFRWLEQALASLSAVGYQPKRYGYIRCLELSSGAKSVFLVLDGNHRISALHALGFDHADVLVKRVPISRQDVRRWPKVLDGTYSEVEALSVFDRYFQQTNPPLTSLHPARLIVDEPPEWRFEHADVESPQQR